MNLRRRYKSKSLTYPEPSSTITVQNSKQYFSSNNSPKKIYQRKKIDYKIRQKPVICSPNTILISKYKKLVNLKKTPRNITLNSINEEYVQTKSEEFTILSSEKDVKKQKSPRFLYESEEIFTFGKHLNNSKDNCESHRINAKMTRQNTVDNFLNKLRYPSKSFINKKGGELIKVVRDHSNQNKKNRLLKSKTKLDKIFVNRTNYSTNLDTIISSHNSFFTQRNNKNNNSNKYVFILNYKKTKSCNMVNISIPKKKNCEISYVIDILFDKYPEFFKNNSKKTVLIAKNNLRSFYKKGECLPFSYIPYQVLLE